MEKNNSVAVFCGSKSGKNPLFIDHATQLGILLAKKNINIIYGGGSVGIMGAVANAAMQNKGVEFSINVVPVQTKDLRWDIDFNFANVTKSRF